MTPAVRCMAVLQALALSAACQQFAFNPEGYACDEGTRCPGGFRCVAGSCMADPALQCGEVACPAPPGPECVSTTTLRTLAPTCEASMCSVTSADVVCPLGCAEGACIERCVGDACPAPSCLDATTLVTYVPDACDGDVCASRPKHTVCINGCQGGRCVNQDLCASVTCRAPPAPTCEGGNVRGYESPGTCEPSTGLCQYSPRVTACTSGQCVGGRCMGNPCGAISCTTPPVPVCTDASTLRRYDSVGVCQAGACSYTSRDLPCPGGCSAGVCSGDKCAGVSCLKPPPASCIGNIIQTYDPVGVCAPMTGQCSYPPNTGAACVGGCAFGKCIPQALTFSRRFPGVSFPITAIDMAPVTGDVLVAGAAGQLALRTGDSWRLLTSATTARLASAAWLAPGRALVVGERGVVLQVLSASGTVSQAVGAPGSVSTNFVSVHGRNGDGLIVSDQGLWARLGTSGWSQGTFPSSSAPHAMRSAYIDELGREHVAGRCGMRSCVVVRFNASIGWFADMTSDPGDVQGFVWAGPSFDIPPMSTSQSESLVGRADRTLVRHQANGNFDTAGVPPLPPDAGPLVSIAPGPAPGASREVFVLTGRAPGISPRLFRLTKGAVAAVPSLVFNAGADVVLSRSEVQGVVAAESLDAGLGKTRNTIISVSTAGERLLDVSEPFTAVSEVGGQVLLATAHGDVLVGGPAGFTRYPDAGLRIVDAEGRNGNGVLLSGRSAAGSPTVARFHQGAFSSASLPGLGELLAVCRSSDAEGWAVGTGGTIASVSLDGGVVTLTKATSVSAATLRAVQCGGPGVAYACGDDSTVLELSGGVFRRLGPAFPAAGVSLLACDVIDGVLHVAADGHFARLDRSGTSWVPLPAQPGLTRLVVRGANDVYGAANGGPSGFQIVRFNGLAWSQMAVSAVRLEGGGQVGMKVVFAGADGTVVEGQ